MKKLSYSTTILTVAAIVMALSAIHLSISEWNEEAIRVLIRWSAKISASLFALAFAASSLHHFFKVPIVTQLLKFRPHIGLAFAVVHTFHLLFLFGLQYFFHPVFTLAASTSLLGGGLAYLLMFLMVFTTFPYFKSMLQTHQWKWLHLIGVYWIWLIFFRSYLKRVVYKGDDYLLFGILVVALLLRVAYWCGHRFNKSKNEIVKS